MSGPEVVEWLARLIAGAFYRIDTVGAAPSDGPVLLLANHPNALLDPAIVITTAGRTVRFIAKSTLFNGPLAPVLRASGAIPVFRRQDEGVDVKRNVETFAAVDEALTRREAVCIFPEGISHSTGRLEPLRTGAARMALSAASRNVPVQLVPVGINPDEKMSFRSRVTVVYGRPFTVAAGTPVPALTAEISEHMRHLIVEADPGADAELVIRVDRLYASERDVDIDAASALERRRTIASGLERLRAQDPERYESALLQLRRYDQRLRRFGLRDRVLDWDTSAADAFRFAVREIPLATVLIPLAVTAALVFAPPYLVTDVIAKLQRDSDVTATAKVIAGAVLYPAWILLIAAVAGSTLGAAWAVAAIVGLPALAGAGLFAIERESAVLRTARSWLSLRGAHHRTRRRLRRHRAELADVLDDLNRWLATDNTVQRP